jgi:glycosyltransferase involved in cell wall biosynthesis
MAQGDFPGASTRLEMKILFAFENALPSNEADAEVFVTTAKYLSPLISESWLHVPLPPGNGQTVRDLAGMPVIAARVPLRPAALRHILCGFSLIACKEFRLADLVYTRNLWIAWLAMLFGQRVAFDHYRPWPDQIPPLQFWLYRLMCHPRFLLNVCHSRYTKEKYLALGIPEHKLCVVYNGFEPQRLMPAMAIELAKAQIGASDRKTVVYTGRINHKKGLGLVVEAAKRLPAVDFILVGSIGSGPIETLATGVTNIRVVPFQPSDKLRHYIYGADVLLIPPSWQPLAEFGSTVLPLKLFLYMASGRAILAGETPDVREVLTHGDTAFLCRPDDPDALVAGIAALTGDAELSRQLGQRAQAASHTFTWQARANTIAALVRDRLRPAAAERGAWNGTQFRAWRRQSLRWLVHLAYTRSWVLPPAVLSTSSESE